MIGFGAQKGKDFKRLPKKTLATFDETMYYVSTKFDGNQIFIVKVDKVIRWFTSDWKEFNLPDTGFELSLITGNFILVAEMNYGNVGKMGARTSVQGRITTERVRFKKGLPCLLDESKAVINIFDRLSFDKAGPINLKFEQRLTLLGDLIPWLPGNMKVVNNKLMTGAEAKAYAEELYYNGWEGCMLMKPDEYYYRDKRVNHSIKLKHRPTADLECIGVTEGEDKYTGMIGALILQDSAGRKVKVGSGLDDEERGYHEDCFIGQIIEIQYEQILDTYQQPVFIRVRDDKHVSD